MIRHTHNFGDLEIIVEERADDKGNIQLSCTGCSLLINIAKDNRTYATSMFTTVPAFDLFTAADYAALFTTAQRILSRRQP